MAKRHIYVSRIRDLLALKSQMAGREILLAELEDAIGVTRQTLHAWMSQSGVKTPPAADKQAKLEAYFGVTWKQMWNLVEVEVDEETPELAGAGV
jgi:transcriptional regulator with XRE-family HTH domain